MNTKNRFERKNEIDNQKIIDLLFSITAEIHTHPWFHKGRDLAEVQEWVAGQLAKNEIFTIPIGSSWGCLVDEEFYKQYKKKKDESTKIYKKD